MKTSLIFFAVASLLSFAEARTTLVKDQDYLPILLKELEGAKNNIDVLAFSFAIDDGQGKIQTTGPSYQVAKKLIDLKKEKGDSLIIRLYIEGERSTVDRNKMTGDFLERAGIVVKYGSTHAKGFSIDHKTILFGSTNLTTQSMFKNNETNILSDSDSIIKGFDQFFENLYQGGKQGSISLERPMIADGAYKEVILNAIGTATKSLQFSIYYFNDADIEQALINAFNRGVQIRGYLNQREIPGSNLVEKNRLTVERLKKAGLNDLHFALDAAFTHSKYIIADQQTIILGTGNWNFSDINNYRQLYVEINDNSLAAELTHHLDEQIMNESSH